MVMKCFEIAIYLLKDKCSIPKNLDSTTPTNKSQPNPDRLTLNVLQTKK